MIQFLFGLDAPVSGERGVVMRRQQEDEKFLKRVVGATVVRLGRMLYAWDTK